MIPSARPCLRQRQLLQTRETIRQAALDLVADRGFSSVSVQDISEAAGVSARTFFNHFRSKDEALVPDVPDVTDEQRRAFLDAADVDLLTALERLLTEHALETLDLAGPRGALYTATRLSRSSPELVPRLLSVFEAFEHQVAHLVAERTGLPPDDLACTVTARTALGTVRAAIDRWWRDAEHEDVSAVLPGAFATLRDLLGHHPRPTAS